MLGGASAFRNGVDLALKDRMTTQALSEEVDGLARRVESEYREMPGLNLTLAQAKRLWGLDHATCERVLMLLVARRVLKRSATGTYLRAP